MNTFSSIKSKTNPRNILGGILGSFEEDYERETSIFSSVTQSVTEAVSDLIQIAKAEPEKKSNENGKFSLDGSIEFKKKQAEINRIKDFNQDLEKNRDRIQRKMDQLFEEEINDIATNLPTEQKNQLLGYQASYRDRSIYQRAELRKKLIEQRKKAEKQEKAAASPKARGSFNVGENGLLMGGERSGGGHWSTTPG